MDRSRDPQDYLASGQAWIDFCEELKGAVAELLRETAPKAGYDLAEGHRFLTRMLRSAFELVVEAGDASRPWFFKSLHETMKIGWDNPDNVHTNAYLNGNHEYRVWGQRGEAHTMSFGFYAGSFGGGGRRTVRYVDVDDLEIAPDGRFEVIVSGVEHPGNWIEIDPDTTTLMVRETFWDKSVERHADLQIECLGQGDVPTLDPDFVVNAGGLINVYVEMEGYVRERALRMAKGIYANTERYIGKIATAMFAAAAASGGGK